MRTSLFVALAATTTLSAQRIIEQEPNGSAATAQAVTFGSQVDANLVAGEQDWYSFALTSASEVHVQTSGNFAINPSVDTAVFLYDVSGTTLLAWDDSSRGVHSDVGVNLPAGNYTVMVVGKTATVAGDYALDLFAYAPGGVQTLEGLEPNNPPLGSPTAITLGDTFSGSLSSPTDEDWYSFTLTAPAIVQAVVMDDGAAPQLDSTLIGLQQEVSPGTWVPVGSTSTITTSHRAFNMAHPAALLPGSYAIRVAAGTATNGTAPVTYSKTGVYAVRTRVLPFQPAITVPESPEPNDTLATAAFMNLGDDATGNTTGSLDKDWFGFTVGSPTTIAAMTENGAVSPVTDTSLTLRDASGNLIASATSGGPAGTSHARLIATVNTPGLYFLEVSGGVVAAVGDYVLHTSGCAPLFVSAAFQQQPPSTNACPGSNGLRPQLSRASSELPQLGSHFTMRVNNALPSAGVITALGFSNTTASGGTVALPVELLMFNAPGCFMRVDPEMLGFGAADANGFFFWDLQVPNDPTIVGIAAYGQVMLADAGNPGGISVSNDVKMVVGNRGF